MIYNADCFDVLQDLPDKSIDAVITDPPYATTKLAWDKQINLDEFWGQVKRVCRGVSVVLTQQPFTSAVVMSNPNDFRYELVWKKKQGTNPLNARVMPLKAHENILVFGKGTYNPQMTQGTPYKGFESNDASIGEVMGGRKSKHRDNPTGERFPTSVVEFGRDRGKHPTQKPVALMEWLVKTYTNLGDIVLDPFMGSGSTGVACKNLYRSFVGVEQDKDYFALAGERLAS